MPLVKTLRAALLYAMLGDALGPTSQRAHAFVTSFIVQNRMGEHTADSMHVHKAQKQADRERRGDSYLGGPQKRALGKQSSPEWSKSRKQRRRTRSQSASSSPIARAVQKARTVDEIDSFMDSLFSTCDSTYILSSSREETEFIRLLGDRHAYGSMLTYLRHHCRKNAFAYTAAITALSQSHDYAYRATAFDLLDEMDTDEIEPTSYTFTALFSCVDGASATVQLLERMRQYENIKPSVHVYNAAIYACSRLDRIPHVGRTPPTDWQTALTIFQQMRQEGIAPNSKTYGSLLHVCAQTGQVRIALSLLQEMQNTPGLTKEPGVLDERVWGAALNACAKAGDYREAMRLLSEMHLSGTHPNTRHLGALLSALAKRAQYEMALDVLEGMHNNTEIVISLNGTRLLLEPVPPDLVAINTVLAACAKADNYEGAKALLERMKMGEFCLVDNPDQRGRNTGVRPSDDVIRPDEISYNTVLSACRDPQEAKALVKEMRLTRRHRYGTCAPTSISYVHAITACRKSDIPDIDTALFFLESALLDDGITPNVFMYSAAIWTAERIGDCKCALSILRKMKSSSIAPNAVSYDGVISSLAFNGLGEEAMRLFEEMKDAGITPTPITFQRLVTAIKKSNSTTNDRIEAFERISTKMDKNDRQAKTGGPVFEALLRAYASVPGGYDDAERLFSMIEGPTDASCLRAMLYACMKAVPSRWGEALSILHSSDISLESVGPGKIDAKALNYAMLACTKEDQWEQALNLAQLYGRPIKKKIDARRTYRTPLVSMFAFNALIAACGRSGRPDVALRVLNEMESVFGVSPDRRSYRSAVIVCNQAEHDKQRHRKQRVEDGPDDQVKEARYSREDDDFALQWWECALSLLRRMKEAHLKPDAQIYSSVISACEAAGQWQRALGVLRSMSKTRDLGDSSPPNLYCFNAAISACEKAEPPAWLEALELYERMKERGGTLRPNEVTLNSLLIALEKVGQKELARSTYDEGVIAGIVSPWKKTTDESGRPIRAMDLHNFSAAMAKAAIRSVMESYLDAKSVDLPKDLVIIVGKGKGSEGNKPVLMPAVQRTLMKEYGIEGTIDASNTGRLVIQSSTLRSFVER